MYRYLLRTIFLGLVLLAYKGSHGQACTPTYAFDCSSADFINNFSTTGGTTNISNLNTGCNGTLPTNLTVINQTVGQIQGLSFGFTVQGGTTWSQGFRIFVDWNQDNDFLDPGEDVYNSVTSATTAFSGTINIPFTATAGTCRMRVVCQFAGVPIGPCATMSFGETEEYFVQVIPSTPCATVTGGTAVASPFNPCPGTTFNLNLTGNTLASGLSYLWLQSTTGPAGPYGPLTPTVTSQSANIPTPTVQTWYRCRVECIATSNFDTSAFVVVGPQPFSPLSPCYCYTSTATSTADDDIGQFSLGTLINPANAPTPQAPNPNSNKLYSNFDTLQPPNLIKGFSYPISIFQINSGFQYDCWTKAYIDYNHNTLWTDPGEQVFSMASNASNGHNPTGMITIPSTATVGLTRLRAVIVESATAATVQPCGSYTWGETEDYVVNILAPGQYDPAVSSIQVSQTSGCMDSCESVQLVFTNFGTSILDLSINNLVVKLKVNSPSGLTVYTDTITSGFLAPNTSNNIFFSFPCVNFYKGQCYTINTDTLLLLGTSNANLVNDTLLAPITVCSSRPNNGGDYNLCLNDTIPAGQGLSISGCPTGFVIDSVLIPFSLSLNGNTPANPTACAPGGSGLFGTGTLPILPASANILSGVLSVINLQLAPLTFTTAPNLTRFSLFAGATPPTAANIYHGGLQGTTLTSSFGCFNYLSNPPAVDLNTIYTGGVPNNPTLNLGHWSTNRCTATNILANCGGGTVAFLKIYYEYIPVGVSWYEQPTGGVRISDSTVFNPLKTPNSILNNSTATGTYTFYGACAADTNCRVASNVIVSGLTYTSVLDTSAQCFGGASGSIFFSATGVGNSHSLRLGGVPVAGSPNLTGYFNNLAAGTYTLRVTDASGCSTKDSLVTITAPSAVVIDSIVSKRPSCTPGGDGRITVFASGGTGAKQYSITTPAAPFFNSNIFNGLNASTYTVTVRDANGCTVTSTHTILPSVAPTWTSLSSTNPVCFGGTTGTITVSGTAGSNPNIYYRRTPPVGGAFSATGNFTGVGAGLYTVRIVDSANCFRDTTVTITAPPQIQFATITNTPVTCNGLSTGGIIVIGGGGSPGYTYTKTSPAPIVGPQPSGSFTGLAAGAYTIRITDNNNCTRDSVITVAQPAVLALSVTSTTNVLCRGASTGVIVATGAGGTAPMNTTGWTISPNVGTQSGNRTFSNLPAGTYTITGTDANGCTATTSVTITQPATNVQVTNVVSTTPTCTPGCDATMTITASGGTTPYTSYNNGITTQAGAIFTSQCAGNFTVTVTDANGCTAQSTHTISTPGAPSFNPIVKTNVSCNGGTNGSFTLTTTGGTGTITQVMTSPAVNPGTFTPPGTYTNLPAGSYTIRATDAAGCSVQSVVSITQPTLLTVGNVTVDSVDCNGGNDGGIIITPNGGTPTYTFTINPNTGVQLTPGNFTGLTNGNYTITITDANSCTRTTLVTVSQPAALIYTSVTKTNVSCFGANDGNIIAQSSGGTGTINTILLPLPGTGPSPLIPPTFGGLNGGLKTIRITDAKGCIRDTVVTIVEPALLVINTNSTTNIACRNDSTGIIVLTPTGGTGTVVYTISPNNPNTQIVGNTISNLAAGTYTITGTDANSCVAVSTVTLSQPATKVDITALIGTTPSCAPGNDGTITVTAGGGTGTLLYGILPIPPNPPYQTSNILTGLGSGTYLVSVIDNNNCTADTLFTITNSSAPTIDSTKNTMTQCFGDSTGSIQVFATGNPPVLYAITASSNGITRPDQPSGLFANLPAGNYTVRVNDLNNCPITTTITVTQPTRVRFINVVTDSVNCNGGSDGSIIVTGTGGTGSLTSTRSPFPTLPNPSTPPTFTYNNLAATTYVVRLQDANGCLRDSSIIIRQPSAVSTALVSNTAVLCNGGSTGTVTVSSAGGTGTKNYILNPGPGAIASTTGIYTNLAAGNYTIIATDVYGCTSSILVTVTQPTAVTQSFVTRDVTCFGGNDGFIRLTASGGVGNYTYGLIPTSPALTSVDSFTNLFAGSMYLGIVSDSNGCIDTSNVNITINQPTQMVFTLVTKTDIECFGASTGSISVASNMGTGAHTYSLNPNLGTQVGGNFTNIPAGTYVVTATDANGCTITTSVTVTENPRIFFSSITNTEERCFGDGQASISFEATGGVSPFRYIFDVTGTNPQGPNTQTTYDSLSTGIYVIRAIDALGCQYDSSYALTGPDRITYTQFEITPTNCLDTDDGKLTVRATGGRGTVYNYSLEPGFKVNTDGMFRDLEAGEYSLRVTDTAGCFIDTTAIIPLPTNPLVVSITKEDLGCHGRGNEGRATANATGGTPPYTYLWSSTPVQTSPIAEGLYQGLHTVDVVDARGCLVRDSIFIQPGECCEEVFLPNAFSPNADGRNDEFRILSSAGIELQQFEIRNRWGIRVWQTNNLRYGWDGLYNGDDAPIGTYYYVVRYKCLTDGKEYTIKGDVIIVR